MITCASDLRQPPIRKTEAWRHQREAFWFAEPLPACLLGLGMGCGKTKVAIDLIQNWECRRVLIICPPSVRNVWRRELERHMARPTIPLILDNGSVAKRTRLADESWRRPSSRETLAIVLNYEAVWREPFAGWVLDRDWDCVSCDESHAIKNYSSNISRFMADLGQRAKRRLCLSGTLLAQTPSDAWGQFRFLDPSIFDPSFTAFRQRFIEPSHERIRAKVAAANTAMADFLGSDPATEHLAELCRLEVPIGALSGLRNAEEYLEKLGRITFACRSDEVLDLPPVMYDERVCELSQSARKVYEDLENRLVADWGEGRLTVTNALARLCRLQQVTSGYLPDDDGAIHHVDSGKIELLRELLEAAGGAPVVVFCRYRVDLESVQIVAEALGRRYGEISHRRKDGLTARGEMAEGIDVLAVQPQSGGLGVDLTRARYAIFYSLSWSLKDFEQAVTRVHRPGQQQSMMVYSLICTDTIDRRIHEAIRGRREVIAAVMDGLARKYAQRPVVALAG